LVDGPVAPVGLVPAEPGEPAHFFCPGELLGHLVVLFSHFVLADSGIVLCNRHESDFIYIINLTQYNTKLT